MKRIGNIWDDLTDYDNLVEAYRKAAKGRRWLWIARHVGRNKEKFLTQLRDDLRNGTYRTAAYKAQIVYEPKRRIIHSLPFFPDRIVHHAILNVLGSFWDKQFIYDSYACRENKGQHAGSMRCMEFVRKYDYVLKCDISKFYHSIPHEKLKLLLRRKIKDKKVLTLLDEVIDSSRTCEGMSAGRGVPIGNLVSQWLGNLYLHQLDVFIKHTHRVKAYVRYCDDFILFSNDKEELRRMATLITEYLSNELWLTLSKCELFPVSHGVDYLGYRHFKGYILVRKSTAKRIRRRMKRIKEKISSAPVGFRRIMGQIASAMGWLKWANSYNLRVATEIEELWRWACDYKASRKIQRLRTGAGEPDRRQSVYA